MLVVFAVTLIVAALFAGLAIDTGSLYVTYGQLKRAVDSAAVAAANDFKRGSTVNGMAESAREVLRAHNVDLDHVDVRIFICDGNPSIGGVRDGKRDLQLQTVVPAFFARCPDVDHGETPRKLIYMDAVQHAPMYFLSLLGINGFDLRTSSMSEAAPIDLIIVLDVSESMASETINPVCSSWTTAGARCPIVDDYDPNGPNKAVFDASKAPDFIGAGTVAGCNSNQSCHPLEEAKAAAKALINTMYDGYDQIGLVTFASQAVVRPVKNKLGNTVVMSNDVNNVLAAVDSIKLNDDPPLYRLMPNWYNPGRFNPVFPDDRDGDGLDHDDVTKLGYTCPNMSSSEMEDRWWDSASEGAPDPFGWGGLPCDDDVLLDAFDWNQDGKYTPAGNTDPLLNGVSEDAYAKNWLNDPVHDPNQDASIAPNATLATLSTCTGCGIRIASETLRRAGRPGSVWVIVFLSDGYANMSDTNAINPEIPVEYANGFCNGQLNDYPDGNRPFGYWTKYCIDPFLDPRYCIDKDDPSTTEDDNGATCPPNALWTGAKPNRSYSPMDYARDEIDKAALVRSTNLKEPRGNDIAIYSIGLGLAGKYYYYRNTPYPIGSDLLRYMAAVGDDGDRTTNPCSGKSPTEDCGQYYYAEQGSELLEIFENIASRIYTRINE